MFRPALAIPCVPLLMLSFACSNDDGETTKSSALSGNEDGGGDSSEGDGPTTTMGAPGSDPVVIELLADRTSMTEGDSVTFTAVVVDADGLDTIVGGKLLTADGTGFYGAFAALGGGTYQIVLSWTMIGETTKIEFAGQSQMRGFLADFVDLDGKHGTRTIEIKLTCDDGSACDGSCVNLDYDPDNCGKCGVVCFSDYCYDGNCL